MKTRALILTAIFLFLHLVPVPSHSEGEVGFLEKFALAPDREAVLSELIPGSDDYYFFHALHDQNTRQKAKLNDILDQWRKRHAESPQRRVIENREALLSYDASPQETLNFLRKRFDLHFDDEQEVADKKPDLPSTLDQALVSREAFQSEALKSEDGIEKVGLAGLERLVRDKAKLNLAQIRSLLPRLTRPDVPNILDLVVTDLQSKESTGFGEFEIHRALLPEQLDELAKRIPSLANNEAFIHTRLAKLAPGADRIGESDPVDTEAWLDRLWAYAGGLSPAYNSIKLRVLYERLRHDSRRGIYDEERFLTYLKLPRRADYINPELFRAVEQSGSMGDLDASDPSASNRIFAQPIHSDENLIRDYFLHLLPEGGARLGNLDSAELLKKWMPYVRDSWLKPVIAEAMITNGIGEPERWASLISPSEFQALKERVDVEFSPANSEFLAPEDDVNLELFLKNTPKLIVKIYEINALSYFLANQRELNTDLPLDGLVANREITQDFTADKNAANPFRRHSRMFKFPELKGRRGAWIIEFIGGGKSSRALVRKGHWSVIQRVGPAGDMLTILDEAHQPVKDAAVWADGRRFTTDEKSHAIILPFAKQASKTAILADGTGEFATLVHIERHSEAYTLDAQFHIAREQLLAGAQATLAMRTALLIEDAQLPLELLENARLAITSTTLDGVVTASEVKIEKLDAAKLFTHTFTVPDRLLQLKAELSVEVASISAGGEKQQLHASHQWSLNQIDREDAASSAHLSKIGGGYVFELLGRNGEPIPNESINFEFHREDFTDSVAVSLSTDEKGRVALGELRGIKTVACPDWREWTLHGEDRTWPSAIHARAGDPITVPWSGDAPPDHVSLLEVRGEIQGTFVKDFQAAITGFPEGAWNPSRPKEVKAGAMIPQLSAFVIKGLPPGDYSLSFDGEKEPIVIRVTAGTPVGNWLLSSNRELEMRDAAPLNIQSVLRDGDDFVIQLANAGASTRVHIAASRFLPDASVFGALAAFKRFDPAVNTPASLPNLYAAGRQIGDEYRYILERRYSKIFPGNMLPRPGLLLDPWAVRSTDLLGQQMAAMQKPGSTSGGRAAATTPPSPSNPISEKSDADGIARADLNFLATPCPVFYNLAPDAHGAVRVAAKAFGDRQYVQIYAEDLTNAASRTLSLPEAPTKFKDLRVARVLDPQKPFAEKKAQTVLKKGETLKLDGLTTEMQTYDSLTSVHALFSTLSRNPNLAKFAWLLDWPTLKPEEKRAKYSEFACHEVNFFLMKKNPDFFTKVVLPYLQNKKEKTFIDDFLLGNDLHGYLAPWAHERLNMAERCLLSQRIPGEAAATARDLREMWELLPPDLAQQTFLFETALRGHSLSTPVEAPEAAAKTAADGKTQEWNETRTNIANEKGSVFDWTLGQAHIPGNQNVFFGGGTSTTPAASPPAVHVTGNTRSGDQLSSGLRSGGAAISPNAIDALLFGQPAANSAPAPAKTPALAALAGVFTDPQFQVVTRALDQEKGVDLLAASSITTKSGQRADGSAQPSADEPQISGDEAKRQRSLVRQFFRVLGPTKEWAETDYYQVPAASQNVGMIPINAFWRDYAAWNGKSPFISANFAEAAHSFSEMMLALAVLDLPFSSPKHDIQNDAAQYTMTAGGPLVVFHKEIEPAPPPKEDMQALVSENFFQSDDRYKEQGNDKSEKYVTGEFVAGVVYGANVVVTNPLSGSQVMDLLLQIPEGAIPVNGSQIIGSKRFRLAPYTTQTFEYYFYFPAPRPKPFAHHPATVTQDARLAGAAKPIGFKVVRQLSEVDKTSWDYISQAGNEADVFAFLDRENIVRIDLARVAWRARKSADFYHKIIALLAARHVYNDVLYSYAVVHNDAPAIGEWLRHRGDFGEDFVGECGPCLNSSLLAIDPIERRAYQHLGYSPLVNQRAHRLGGDHRIPNPIVRSQYLSLLNILAFKPALDAMDQMSLVYYLFLQYRTEEALARFHAILPNALPTRLQYDYFSCYAAFFEERLGDARGIANRYSEYPVDRWRKLFAGVAAQLDEIEGKTGLTPSNPAKTSANASGPPPAIIRHSDFDISSGSAREVQQGDLAATEPSFDFKVENHQIALTWKNIGEVTVRYYLMDPEFLFSANPFVTADSTRAAIIKPKKSVLVKLPEGKDTLQIPLPVEFNKANLLIEIIGAGQRKSQAFHANTLKLAVAENYGHLELRDEKAGRPVSKAYIKVYARLRGGAIRFFKDGYTDLRGKFDYASLNSSDASGTQQSAAAPARAGEASTYQMLQPQELRSVEKLSILVLSEAHGVMVREVNPPSE